MSSLSLRRAMVWNTFSSLLLPLAAVLTGPLLARALGPDGRGEMSAALSPTLLALSLANLGLPTAVLYFVSRGDRAASVLARAVPIALGCGLIAIATLVLLEPVLLKRYPDQHALYLLIAATLPLALVVELLRDCSQGLGRYELALRERWWAVGSRVLLLVVFFAAGGLTVTTAGLVSWLPGILVGVVYLGMILRLRSTHGPAPRTADVVSYSFRSWGADVAGVLVMRLDQVLLLLLTTSTEIGYYVVAVAISEVPLLAVTALRGVLTAASTSRNDPHLVARTCRVTILASSVMAAGMMAVVPFAVPLLFGTDFREAVGPTQVLLVASLIAGIGGIAGAGLSAIGRPGLNSGAQGLGVVATLALLPVLAPPFGGLGAAWASLGSYVVAGAATVWFFSSRSEVRVRECLLPRRSDLDDLMGTVLSRLPGRRG